MKTVLITGANKGIGFETARQLAQLGYFVYVGSREITKGIEAVNKLKSMGLQHVDTIQIDVSDKASVVQAKTALASKIKSLDILINNAAITGEQPQNISTTPI